MLILTRKQGERICIGGRSITITVLDIESNFVRLGIDAPPDISIYREEVQQRIEATQQDSA